MLALLLQLAKVLLQLHHHGPCISVCLKALTDAARAADVAWSAQLQGLQAVALVAQEEYLPALNCYRSALARWVVQVVLSYHNMRRCQSCRLACQARHQVHGHVTVVPKTEIHLLALPPGCTCRLEQHRLPASLVLPLQLDYAALCDEVGACGDFDRLAGASLAASTAEMQDMGLAEMMVSGLGRYHCSS